MSSDLEELYQEVILDHSRKPRNFGELPDATVRVHGDNPSCGDEIHLAIKISPDGRIDAIGFTGQGCAISQASASLMTMKLNGKTRDEALSLADRFHQLLSDKQNGETAKSLGDLQALSGVGKFPQRVKCAMLPWRALEQALQQPHGESSISTEIEA